MTLPFNLRSTNERSRPVADVTKCMSHCPSGISFAIFAIVARPPPTISLPILIAVVQLSFIERKRSPNLMAKRSSPFILSSYRPRAVLPMSRVRKIWIQYTSRVSGSAKCMVIPLICIFLPSHTSWATVMNGWLESVSLKCQFRALSTIPVTISTKSLNDEN